MSRRFVVVLATLVGGAAHAAPANADDAAVLRAVAELAESNGQALACRDAKAAQRAKSVMLSHAPKTARIAAAFDEGTQRGFLQQTRGQPGDCPDAAALLARLDGVAQRLQAAVAGGAHAPVPTDGDAEPLPLASVPRYLLQSTRGGAVTSEDFRGRFQLLTFGFTSCPDVCPTTLLELQQVLAALGERAAQLQPIFVTLDPQRDTPAVVEAYTQAFDPRIVGLTGPEALVRRAAESFRVRMRKVQEPGAKPDVYTIEHTAGSFLLGRDGQLLERIAYGTPVREMVARIEVWMTGAAAK